MVNDLNMPVKIRACPIIREADGLAMSSRNVYLSAEERKEATILFRSLNYAEQLIEAGEKDVHIIRAKLKEMIRLNSSLAQIDYIEIRSYPSLKELTSLELNEEAILVALAIKFGQTRLIDNKIIGN